MSGTTDDRRPSLLPSSKRPVCHAPVNTLRLPFFDVSTNDLWWRWVLLRGSPRLPVSCARTGIVARFIKREYGWIERDSLLYRYLCISQPSQVVSQRTCCCVEQVQKVQSKRYKFWGETLIAHAATICRSCWWPSSPWPPSFVLRSRAPSPGYPGASFTTWPITIRVGETSFGSAP